MKTQKADRDTVVALERAVSWRALIDWTRRAAGAPVMVTRTSYLPQRDEHGLILDAGPITLGHYTVTADDDRLNLTTGVWAPHTITRTEVLDLEVMPRAVTVTVDLGPLGVERYRLVTLKDTANLDAMLARVVADDLGSGGLTVSWDEDARRYVAEEDYGTVIPDDIATWSYCGGLDYQYDYDTVTDDSGLLESSEFVDSVAQLDRLIPDAIVALLERRTVTIARVIVTDDDLEWDELGNCFVDDSGDVMADNIAGWAIIYSVHRDA